MASCERNVKSIPKMKSINIPDLEKLLRKSLRLNDLQVINYSATRLLPAGENYGSILLKLEVKIRENLNAKEETKNFVAKTPIKSDNPVITWKPTFIKEVFMYTDILPMYKNLEREVGVNENDTLDFFPKYIGHRYSLDNNSNEVDDYSLLVMENIRTRQFYNCDKSIGLDLEHAKIALLSLARYHALGIAMKRKRPDFFEKALPMAKIVEVNNDQIDQGFDGILQTFRENKCFAKHLPIIESSFTAAKYGKVWRTIPVEPWATITHGDFWTNNLLFHKNANGEVDDVKFVDFQLYLYNSPLKDLPYFLCGNLDMNTKNNHFDELLNCYYETFISSLERLGCDNNSFTRKSFDEELKKQAINEFPLCTMAIKFFAFEVNESNDDLLAKTVFESKISDKFKQRLVDIVDLYEKRKWF